MALGDHGPLVWVELLIWNNNFPDNNREGRQMISFIFLLRGIYTPAPQKKPNFPEQFLPGASLDGNAHRMKDLWYVKVPLHFLPESAGFGLIPGSNPTQ